MAMTTADSTTKPAAESTTKTVADPMTSIPVILPMEISPAVDFSFPSAAMDLTSPVSSAPSPLPLGCLLSPVAAELFKDPHQPMKQQRLVEAEPHKDPLLPTKKMKLGDPPHLAVGVVEDGPPLCFAVGVWGYSTIPHSLPP